MNNPGTLRHAIESYTILHGLHRVYLTINRIYDGEGSDLRAHLEACVDETCIARAETLSEARGILLRYLSGELTGKRPD